ncbi:acyl dehydratase [Comamonas serinivorans]|uniref:Acyl dehydratase n=2 Tax=Comamonas serinivorans TaxID=1082851 RepID=A0A1Y0EP37_9BURK|nr:acyl dehydratase [Comamonas serinivorans]
MTSSSSATGKPPAPPASAALKPGQPGYAQVPRMGRGFVWQELQVGQQLRTFRRTITEADLVNFVNATGMLEAIFLDTTFEGAAMRGRPVPGALTYTFIEGFILQSMIQGTGLAMLELHQQILAPVCVGDSIEALVEVTDIRPTSQSGRAVVTSRVDVFNQSGTQVMRYVATRLLAGEGQT